MHTDIAEQLCQAVDTIVQERLKAVSYDTTIACTIVDASDSLNGTYRVNNGSAKFIAYSQDTSFKVNDVVYVSIPNGNYDNDKIILCKKPKDSDKPISYIQPFDKYVDITGNLFLAGSGNQFGLIANYDLSLENQYDYKTVWSYNGGDLGGYTRLGIQASFQAWLKELNAVSGSYGLRIKVLVVPEDEEGLEKEETELEEKWYDYYFDCTSMPGNPYGYDSFYSQEIVFDISQFYKIRNIEIEFYEISGSFKDANGNYIAEAALSNIFAKDFYVSLGYDAESFKDDQVVIYSLNSSQYIATEDPEEDNHKNIQLRWVHRDDNDNIKVVNLNSDLNYSITWYRRVLGHRSDTVYSGVDWAQLSTQIVENSNCYYEIKDTEWLNYNSIAYNKANGVVRSPEFHSTWLLPDITMAEERVKAIITYNDQPIYSNILTFTNRREVVSKPTVDAVQALSINCEDNSYGNYLIYNLGGSLIDTADTSKVREFKAYYKSADDKSETATQLTEASQIEWIIPTKNTMIILDEEYLSGNIEDCYVDGDGFQHIIRYGESDGSIVNQNTQRYRISSHYTQAYSNNTITCKIIKDKTTYTAVKELTFGSAGTSGTDYTFVLDFNNGATALTLGSDEAIYARARLYNYDGSEVANLESESITWDWLNGENLVAAIQQAKNNLVELKLKNNIITEVPANNYSILRASLDYNVSNGKFTLEAYLPIPIRSDKKYSFISGATTVCYNSLGYLDSYYQMPYKIYGEEENGDWYIYDDTTWEINSSSNTDMVPTIDDNNRLNPKNYYAEDSGLKAICVVGSIAGAAAWSQPIYIYQNKYPSSIINDWDGELLIDNDNNAILSAKMVAGTKNSDNTFTGVIMGDWGDKETEDDYNSGLYGFLKGQASFGFETNGKAFIGLPSSGRLNFDGEKSIIQSEAYIDGDGGMAMDFRDGWIKMYDNSYYNKNERSIIFDTTQRTTPFKIGSHFSVDWDGTIHAEDGDFQGTVQSDIGIFEDLNVYGSLDATSANVYMDKLTIDTALYSPYLYFGSYKTTSYKYYKLVNGKKVYQGTVTSKPTTVAADEVYQANGTTNTYAGYIGIFEGSKVGGEITTVVGIQNNSDYNTVIEGSGKNLRIGNNGSNGAGPDSIIIQGSSCDIGFNDGGDGTAFRLGFDTSSGGVTKKFRPDLVQIYGADGAELKVLNIEAENQHGIYARFA